MSRRHLSKKSAGKGASADTRGRILLLLCRTRQTVNDLSAALGVTDNAIRAQLDRLSAGGLVRQVGSRPGIRRPHAEFELTELGAELFPKAYQPALRLLVEVLLERLPAAAARELLLDSGKRLVQSLIGDSRETDPRRWSRRVLERLGGAAAGVELLEQSDQTVIRSCTCPLAALTRAHPELCGMVAEMLAELSGMQVHEHCTKGNSPRCSFQIVKPTGNKS